MRRIVAGLLLVAAVAGCSMVPGVQDPTGPVIVTGTVLDPQGQPAPDAEVTLQVADWSAELDVGETVPIVFTSRMRTDASGTFTFRGAPTPEVLARAGDDGSVNLDLITFGSGQSVTGWTFSRELDGSTWAGDPPTIELRFANDG